MTKQNEAAAVSAPIGNKAAAGVGNRPLLDEDQLIAVFDEWERRWRDEPARFLSDQERLAAQTLSLAHARAAYVMQVNAELEQNAHVPDELGA